MMKAKTAAFVVAALLLLAMSLPVSAGEGNLLPSGPHYNLNIIGVSQAKNPNIGCGNGHRIFVGLGRKDEGVITKIMLNEGTDFQVLDCDGTDGQAYFQLPPPDPENDGVTEYSVYARALGQPGGTAWMGSCGIDEYGTEWCSVAAEIVELNAHGNNNKFVNVSRQLLYVWVDLDGDGTTDRYPLFADELEEYFWKYNNEGLKILQLRFYPGVPTDVGTLTNG
jgi:hypothetical protein